MEQTSGTPTDADETGTQTSIRLRKATLNLLREEANLRSSGNYDEAIMELISEARRSRMAPEILALSMINNDLRSLDSGLSVLLSEQHKTVGLMQHLLNGTILQNLNLSASLSEALKSIQGQAQGGAK